MTRHPALDARLAPDAREPGRTASRPVTAIPVRFVAERERVLRMMERWSAALQGGGSLPATAR